MRPQRGPTVSLVAAGIGFGAVVLDTTAVTVVLPAIGAEFAVGGEGLRWVPVGSTLAFAALMLTGGALGDRFGAGRVFGVGLAVFAAAAMVAGTAADFGVLIAARVAQGVAAAVVVPSSLALLRAAYPDGRARAAALGVWGGAGGLAAGAGPLAGGALAAVLGWRAVFLVHLPVALAGLLLLRRAVSPPPRRDRPLGLGTQCLGAAGLVGVTYGLAGGRLGEPAGWLPLAAGAVTLVAFRLVDRRSRSPVLPGALLADRHFRAAAVVGALINLGFYGQLFVLTLHFGTVRGYDVLTTGLALAAQTVVGVIASPLGGRAAARHGPGPTLVLGLGVGAAGLAGLAAVTATTPYPLLLPALVAVGFGTAFAVPAATAWALRSVAPELAGLASGLFSASRQFGGTLGVGLVGGLSVARGGHTTAALLAAGGYLLAAAVGATAGRDRAGGTAVRAGSQDEAGDRDGAGDRAS